MSEHDGSEKVKNLLAFALVGSFVCLIPLFVWQTIPDGNRDLITYMVGQLSGMALTALGFYFVNKAGQDALDTKRAENTGKLAEAFTAATNSTVTPADDPEAIQSGDKVTVSKAKK